MKAILLQDRRMVDDLARRVGKSKARALLERAAKDLESRLSKLRAPGGAEATFTEAHMRMALAQVKAALAPLTAGLGGVTRALGKQAAELTAEATIAYAKEAEKRFKGIAQPLQIDEAAVFEKASAAGASSVVRRIAEDPQHPGKPGVLDRYGGAVMDNIENELGLRFLAKRSWQETIEAVTEKSPFLQGAPAYWAERLVRTEVMSASNSAAHAGIQALDDELGDACKVLVATFDNRTAADSFACHGQIRRPKEYFDTWQGKVMHPPARPNDREVVVPHRISWPIPAELEPRSPGEVSAKWREEGHRGGHPPIPKRSTIDLALFGKPQKPKSGQAVHPQKTKPQHPLLAEVPSRDIVRGPAFGTT